MELETSVTIVSLHNELLIDMRDIIDPWDDEYYVINPHYFKGYDTPFVKLELGLALLENKLREIANGVRRSKNVEKMKRILTLIKETQYA